MPPEKECFAVIFTGTKSENTKGYDEAAMAMFKLATEQEGFISIEFSQMGETSITVSYWHSLESIQNWKNHPKHKIVQEKGNSTWYKNYTVKVAKVLREYSFDNS
ncbi:MAG: antibiotic biosynthesis monooxygenase [Pseudomonadales bacterium]|nr:antibiotic biosynthesis monooxygenase [Pseudomonadales bacterium]